jgi:hypothetical protein
MYTKQNYLVNFFPNIAEITDVPLKVEVQYSQRLFTMPPDNKAVANDLGGYTTAEVAPYALAAVFIRNQSQTPFSP